MGDDSTAAAEVPNAMESLLLNPASQCVLFPFGDVFLEGKDYSCADLWYNSIFVHNPVGMPSVRLGANGEYVLCRSFVMESLHPVVRVLYSFEIFCFQTQSWGEMQIWW